MNHRFASLLALPLAAAAVLSAVPATGDASSPQCSNASLSGGYGFSGGGGAYGNAYQIIFTAVFDGSGGMAPGKGTAVFEDPAAVEHVEFQGGTYSVAEDCTGSARFFAAHENAKAVDHFHNVEFVLTDEGRGVAMTLVSTEYRDGAPSLPTEQGTYVGRRM